jgi:hypothetical protein
VIFLDWWFLWQVEEERRLIVEERRRVKMEKEF